MSEEWTDLQPDTNKPGPKAPVRFGLSKIRSAPAKGVVLITAEVLAQLGMKNWRVAIRIGKGARAHQIAIVPDMNGPFELQEMGKTKGGGTFRVRLPLVERWPDEKIAPFERPYKVETAGKQKILVIDLPAFCFDANAKRQITRA